MARAHAHRAHEDGEEHDVRDHSLHIGQYGATARRAGFRRQTKWLTRQTLAHAFKGLSAPSECVAAVEAALRELSGRRVRVPTQLEVQP